MTPEEIKARNAAYQKNWYYNNIEKKRAKSKIDYMKKKEKLKNSDK